MESSPRSKLTEVKRREICAILAVGCSRTAAARYVGCHPDTIRNTAKREPEFAAEIEQAESQHEIRHLTHINAAAKEGRYWRAAAWALERTYPDRYGRRRPHTLNLDQMSQVLAQFAGVILEEVTDEQTQERVFARLADLTSELQSLAVKGNRK
jgi:hypothetical protein